MPPNLEPVETKQRPHGIRRIDSEYSHTSLVEISITSSGDLSEGVNHPSVYCGYGDQ